MRRTRGRFWLRFGFRLVSALVTISVLLVLPWRWLPPPTTAFMLRARLVEDRPLDHRWVSRSRISRNLTLCAVASEDQKFPTHHGFDLQSIWSAVQEDRSRPRGASTISQQVAKNLYLWPGRSFARKGLEAWMTLWIELLWPKGRVLEVYLNVAEFGPGVFGAEAGSQRAFGKPASDLTLREAALLTAVLPNPRRMSAARPSEYVRERATEIEAAARALGPSHVAGL